MRSQALAGLLRRVEQTGQVAAGRFPMFADPQTGEWTWSQDGGWSGGFWPGMLWLAAAATGERRFAGLAADSTQRLRSRASAPTVLRGFLFWYGAGIASVLDPAQHPQAELTVAAARSLAADVDPVAAVLPPGQEDADLYRWPRPGACIDAMPGTVPLLAFAAARTGEDRLRSIALAHARGLSAFCVRADGSVAQSATYDRHGQLAGQATIEGSSRDSTWARGTVARGPGRGAEGRRAVRHHRRRRGRGELRAGRARGEAAQRPSRSSVGHADGHLRRSGRPHLGDRAGDTRRRQLSTHGPSRSRCGGSCST